MRARTRCKEVYIVLSMPMQCIEKVYIMLLFMAEETYI